MKLFEPNELKQLSGFYVYEFVWTVFYAAIIPFMTIYFVEIGLSFSQIALLYGALTASMVAFEIPTGALADHYSRKYSVILGLVIMGLALLPVPLTDSFWLLLGLFVLQGFGMTFASGAEEAWVVDNLKKVKASNLIDEYYLKATVISAAAGILAPLVGSLIVGNFSFDWLWYLFGGGSVLAAIYAWLFLPELRRPSTHVDSAISGSKQNIRVGLSFLKTHKRVQYVILGSVFFGVMWAVDDLWQPFLVELSLPITSLGLVYSGMSAIILIVPFGLKLFGAIDRHRIALWIALTRLVLALSVVVLSPSLLPLAIAIFVLSGSMSELSETVFNPLIQKQIPSQQRATIMSIYNMGLSGAIALFGLLFGWVADAYSIKTAIIFGGAWGVLSVYFFWRATKVGETSA